MSKNYAPVGRHAQEAGAADGRHFSYDCRGNVLCTSAPIYRCSVASKRALAYRRNQPSTHHLHSFTLQTILTGCMATENFDYQNVFNGLRDKIRLARQRVASTVNTELLVIYLEVGNTILQQKTAKGWGSNVISRLSTDLKIAFPDMQGFSKRNLVYMQTFAAAYPDFVITQTLSAQLQNSDYPPSAFTQPLLAQLSPYTIACLLTSRPM